MPGRARPTARISIASRLPNATLKTMEAGKAEFPNFSAKLFFEALYQSAMEGFFADPIYGGNRNKVSWRMVGYPGLPATYAKTGPPYPRKKVVIEPQPIPHFSYT